MEKKFLALMLCFVSIVTFSVSHAQDTSSPTYRYVIDVSTSTENGVTTVVTTWYYPNLGKTTKDVKQSYPGQAIHHSQENYYQTSESDFRSWTSISVLGIYEEISPIQANQYGYDECYKINESEGDRVRFFRHVQYGAKIFDVSLCEMIDTRFYGLCGTRYYVKFSGNSISKGDRGKLDWNGDSGVLYIK